MNEKIARMIVNLNMNLKEKESVLIAAGPRSLKFAEMIAFECSRIGAQPIITYGSDRLSLKTYKIINKKFLKNYPKFSEIIFKNVDAEINLGEEDPQITKQLPQKKIEIRRKTLKPLRNLVDNRMKKRDIKYALLEFPTPEMAKGLGTSFTRLNRIYWGAMQVNYNELYKSMLPLYRALLRGGEVRIIGERTNLKLSIKGRTPLIGTGVIPKEKLWHLNLPDGEVFIPPVESATEGEIYFDLPCMGHYGKRVKGLWLKFKKGRLVDYDAEQGLKNFEDLYKNASGDKDKIGELGIGMNPKAKPTGGLIIVDEKVKGTIHLALGENKHMGGKNDATIHWDFFKDMRKNGQIFVDGKLIMKNGQFLI